MSTRRKAREVALQSIYWAESSGDPIEEAWEEMSRRAKLPPKLSAFALELGMKAIKSRECFDGLIADVTENWRLERIARVDKIILRMALAELFFFDEVPPKVSLNEAIELAKKFGGEGSAAFVNGVLDAIVKKNSEILNHKGRLRG